MPEVIFNNDDVTVLGPPEFLNVQVDVGPTGLRGSQIFVGTGNPNSISIGQTPLLNDLFINNRTGSEYSYLYQYVSRPGGNTWIPVLKVNPTIYSGIYTVDFSNGSGQVKIPLVNIIETSGVTVSASNFAIQFSIGNDKPTCASISSTIIGGISNDELQISFKGTEFSGGSWIDLEDTVTVHLLITIVVNY